MGLNRVSVVFISNALKCVHVHVTGIYTSIFDLKIYHVACILSLSLAHPIITRVLAKVSSTTLRFSTRKPRCSTSLSACITILTSCNTLDNA